MKTMPIRDMLYEEPGPKTRRTITIVTILEKSEGMMNYAKENISSEGRDYLAMSCWC